MPERHVYSLRAWAGDSQRCQAWGCPLWAVYEAVYRFQRTGEAHPTRRTWGYCQRHGTGWAAVHVCTVPEPAPLPAGPPVPTIRPDPGPFGRRVRHRP